MKNFIQKRNYGKRTRRLFGVVLVLMTFMSFNNYVNAECSLSAKTDIDVFVDENCEAEVSFDALLTDDGASCSTNADDYIVTIYSDNGGVDTIATGNRVPAIIPSGYAGQTVYGKVEYNEDANQTNLIPIDVFDKLNPTIACYDAIPTNTNFEVMHLETSDPNYHRTNSSLTPLVGNCGVTGISVNYDVFEFSVDEAGAYGLYLYDNNAGTPSSTQFFVALYDGDFDPNHPCVNFVLDTYDGETDIEDGVLQIPYNLLAFPSKYTLVTTTVQANETGDYYWHFKKSTGNILVENPDCEYTLNCYDNIDDKVIILGKDNCSNPTTVNIVNSKTITNNCQNNPSLEDTILRTVHNVYQADDGFGNFSDTLPVNIVVNSIDPATFASIIFPGDSLVSTGTSISCSQPGVPLLDNGNPDPEYTGWPTLNGENISGFCTEPGCKLIVTYTDLLDPTCSTVCKKRILRTWTISDASCNNLTPITRRQKIEIADLTAPVVTCPSSESVNTNQFNCFDTYTFPVPAVTDNCQSTWEWDILIKNNSNVPQIFIDNAVAGVSNTHDLPVDVNHITYTITDACGNKSSCKYDVTVTDNVEPVAVCQTMTTVSLTTENACYVNPVKVITRNFTATDDGGRTDECTQTITFVRNKYFGYTNGSTNPNANGAITWPNDVTNDGCIDPNTASDPNSPLHPNQTGRPKLNEFVCDQVGATYSDFLVIDNDNDLDNNEACFKIIRTWTVLDDCHKIDEQFAKWYHDQVILITNSIDPTMDATPDKVVCTYDTECTDGAIVLEYLCHDDCTQDEDLRWRYYIDYDKDNIVGVWDSVSPIFSGNELNASGDYRIGTHKILWQVWDQCGNSIVQEQQFTIQNCKKPTPRCCHVAVDLTTMNGNASAYMSAEMLDMGSDHTCGYPLVFSFSADTTDKGRWYGCNDQGLNTVEMWVTAVLPSGDTIKDYCVTTIDVQDNNNLCGAGGLPQSIVSGAITTEDNIAVQGLKVNLLGSEQGAQTTNEDGEFAFPAVDDNQSYRVAPVSTDDYLNGLSTLDLVIIQKHILGIKDLDSPYKMLASDVNSDNKITSSDILTLRKLILGINTELPKSAAWKYMPKDYDFENPNHPYSEYTNGQFVINSLNEDTKADFIAIKVGDVNVDAVVNSDEIESRSDGSIAFAIDNKRFERNETVEIPVYAKDFVDMQGFQGTFTFDKNILEFVEIESGALDISSVNFATNRLENGYIPMSWYKATAMDVEDDAVLFTVRFNSLDIGSVKEAFSINSNITKSEAYSTVLENINLSIEYRNDESGFALLQNRPNPFNNNTEIYFSLPMASAYTLSIFDLNGKLIYETNGSAQKGMNTIQLNKESVNTTGVLYYTLSTDKYTATRKMVVIK